MKHTTTQRTGTTMKTTRGREGPRHDPYSYIELTIKRPEGAPWSELVIHGGMTYYLEVDGTRIVEGDSTEVESMFRQLVGTTPERLEQRSRSRTGGSSR